MIEQLPVGVMTAEPTDDFHITYVNAKAKQILDLVGDQMGVRQMRWSVSPSTCFTPVPSLSMS